MGKRVKGTKLIDGCYRRPHTKQEKIKLVDALEQGINIRGKRSQARIPDVRDDINIDKSKTIPYNTDSHVSHKNWKARAKCRKQWERKGNIVFEGTKHPIRGWCRYDWKKVNLEKKV